MVDIYLSSSDKKFVANKDPHATLDYTWDWTEYLNALGDTILSANVVSNGGVTVVTQSVIGGKKVTAFVSGGTIGQQHSLTCTITTGGGRVDERTIYLNINNR